MWMLREVTDAGWSKITNTDMQEGIRTKLFSWLPVFLIQNRVSRLRPTPVGAIVKSRTVG